MEQSTQTGATKRQMNRLSAKEMYRVTNYVAEHYTASGDFDTVFAKKASEALGFPVSESSIDTARKTLDIPNNRDVQRAARSINADEAVLQLSERVVRLASLVESLVDRLVVLETHQRVLIAFAQRSGPVEGLEGLQFRVSGGTNSSKGS